MNIGGWGERVLASTPRPGNRFGSVVRATRGFLSYVLFRMKMSLYASVSSQDDAEVAKMRQALGMERQTSKGTPRCGCLCNEVLHAPQ